MSREFDIPLYDADGERSYIRVTVDHGPPVSVLMRPPLLGRIGLPVWRARCALARWILPRDAQSYGWRIP